MDNINNVQQKELSHDMRKNPLWKVMVVIGLTSLVIGVGVFAVQELRFKKQIKLLEEKVEQLNSKIDSSQNQNDTESIVNGGTENTEQKFSEIKECIMGVNVDYNSNINVKSLSDVEVVFNKYIISSKENKKEIFGHNPEFYRFKSATIHGIYQGKKYWEVTTEWYGNDPENKYAYGKWMPEEIFDVSENGEVVRLLGCI